jgi:hypothetical protein
VRERSRGAFLGERLRRDVERRNLQSGPNDRERKPAR